MPNYVSNISNGSTSYPIGGTNFDGSWIISTYEFFISDGTLGGNTYHTYSLSNYLPSDNYVYEAIFTASGNSVATSGRGVTFTLYSGTNTTGTYGWRVGRCIARTAATVAAGGSARIPIFPTDRNITIATHGTSYNATGVYFAVRGYRRLGTNA